MKALSTTLHIHTNQLLLSVRKLLYSLILLPWLTACSDKTQLPEPPLFFPFDTQTAGFKIETDIRVVDHKTYMFGFDLEFNEGDARDRDRVKKLAGGYERNKDGKIIQPGIPIPVRIRISATKPSTLESVFELEIMEQSLSAWGDGHYSTKINDVRLKPGTYHLLIENLKSIPELRGTPVTLSMTSNPKTLSIPD